MRQFPERAQLRVWLLNSAGLSLVLAALCLGSVEPITGCVIAGTIALVGFLFIDIPPHYLFAFPTGVIASLVFLLWGPGTLPFVTGGWVLSLIGQYVLWRWHWFLPPLRARRAAEEAAPGTAMVRFISTGSWVLVDWVVGLLVSLPLYRLSGGQFPAQIETWGQLGAVMLVLLTVNTVWYSLSVARATWEQDEADVRAVPTLRIFAQSLFGIFLPLPGSVLILFALQQYHDKGLLALLVWTAASLPLHAAVKALLNAYSAHLALQQELAQQRQAVMLASRTSMIVHEVSHELGTLNLLVHLAEAAARQSGPAATAALTSLHDIRQVVQQLEQTIEHFRIAVRTQRVQYQPVRVGDLVHATLEALRSEPTTPPIHYEGKAEDMMLAGDAVLLKHALLNVLRNACEASPAGAPIELAVERDSIGKCVNITVSDQGKGIAAADLEEVCSPFFTTKAKGLGLGLALVREIVEAHGGSLGIAAQLHRGTKVTLTLPLPPVPTHLPD